VSFFAGVFQPETFTESHNCSMEMECRQ